MYNKLSFSGESPLTIRVWPAKYRYASWVPLGNETAHMACNESNYEPGEPNGVTLPTGLSGSNWLRALAR